MSVRIAALFVFVFAGMLAKAQCGDPLLEICYQKLGKYDYVNSYPVKMKKTKRGNPPNLMRQSVILHNGVKYKFVVSNAEEYKGRLIVDIYSNNNLVASSYDHASGEFKDVIEFICRKPGIHYIVLYFEKGDKGCAMCLMGQFSMGSQTSR